MTRLLPLMLMLAGCAAPDAIAPGQIVSNNPCVDAILADVAAPGQIGAVSQWSHNPASASAPLDWARAHPALGLTAEEVIAARPRLLLTGNLATGGTNAAIARAGIPMRAYGVPASVDESLAQIRDISAAIGRPAQGAALIADIRRATAVRPSQSHPSAIIWQSGGFVPGKGSLQDELLARAGFTNASRLYGLKQWDLLPSETLLRNPPDIIFMPESAEGQDGRALAARKALLRHLSGRTRIIAFPDKLLFCGGPTIIPAMQRLRQAL
ncbi:MAG: ABC transporter substrate-binding protein [Chakrabartia sp.]